MRHQHIASLGALLVAVALVISGCAQPTETKKDSNFQVRGSISGIVVDSNDVPLAGVTVTYNNSRSVESTKTNSAGMYEINNLASGNYSLVISGGSKVTTKYVNTLTGTYAGASTLVIPSLDVIKTALQSTTTVGAANVDSTLQNTSWMADLNEYRTNLSVAKVQLYPLTASMTGVAYMEIVDGSINQTVLVPEGFKIGIKFSGISPLFFEGEVGENGVFLIENLPATAGDAAGASYDFYIVSSTTVARKTFSTKIDDANYQIADGNTVTNGLTTKFRDGETVEVGNLTFIAKKEPTIIATTPNLKSVATFNPLTGAAVTPLVFTFSKAMNTTVGTLEVTTDAAVQVYKCTLAWDATGTILTVTPPVQFAYGKTVTAAFTGFKSLDNVAMTTVSPEFETTPALALKSTNVDNPYIAGNYTDKAPVAGDIVLTFSKDLVSYDKLLTVLTENVSGKVVPATITPATNTLTINPTADLKFGMVYKVTYKVTDGITTLGALNFTFTTAKSTVALVAPVIALDSIATQKYDGGDTNITIRYSYNENYTYTPMYSVSSDSTTWVSVASLGAPTVVKTGYAYATVVVPAIISGETTSVKLVATSTATGDLFAESNVETVTDTTAPTALTVNGTAVTAVAAPATVVAVVPTVIRAANAVDAGLISFTVRITSGEDSQVPTFTGITAAVMSVAETKYTKATATWTIYLTVVAGQDYTTQNSVVMTVKDAAGIPFDRDSSLTAIADTTLDFN